MQPLAPLDAVFWNFDTPTTHQAIASFCILEDFIDFEAFVSRAADLPLRFPKVRQRVTSDLYWVDDPNFSVHNHVRYVYRPDIRTRGDLVAIAGEIFSEGIDLSRPLWRFTVVTNGSCLSPSSNLNQKLTGIVFCIHHTLADGLGGLELVDAMFDQSREKLRGKRSHATNKNEDNSRPGGIVILARQSIKRWISEYFAPRAKGVLNGQNSTSRTMAVRAFDIAPLRKAKVRAGVSFNDVVLTLVAGSIRRYFEQWGEPVRNCRVLIPVNLRVLGERNTLGNRITGIGVSLPVREPELLKRLAKVSETFKILKEDGSLGAYAVLGNFIAKFPRALQRLLCESQARRTNFICTNMPGKGERRTLFGIPVLENYGLAALMRGHGIAFGFITYAGNLCAAVVGDSGVVPDPSHLLDFFDEERRALMAALEVDTRKNQEPTRPSFMMGGALI